MNSRQRFAPIKSTADYAAIAVAPLLIFLMISSLANFLMLVLYKGGFPQRVSWTLLMFTLGAVGIARVAIEKDRMYAMGYAGTLGFVAFIAMLRFADSPLFSAFILVVIAYLSDIIVRDCTLIDDTVDASGQGLADSGRLFIKAQIENSDTGDNEFLTGNNKVHQPGRTVMYFAFAALPLFGLGQFFLRNDADTWARAQKLLAFYLFASLSLLVTTSFLGLRRYLRQRRVEMPKDVSIAWLTGGMAIVAVVLLLAFLAPLPGRALATFEVPEFWGSPGTTTASKHGTGDEGADKSSPDAPGTTNDPNSDDKEIQSTRYEKGAEAGDAGDGEREDGPAGKQQGGKKQQQGSPTESQQSQQGKQDPSDSGQSKQQSQNQQRTNSESQKSQQQNSQQQNSQQQNSQQQDSQQQNSQQQNSQQQNSQQQDSQQQNSRQQDSNPPTPGEPPKQGGDNSPESENQSDESKPQNQGSEEKADDSSDAESDDEAAKPNQQNKQQSGEQSQQQNSQKKTGGLPPESSSSNAQSSKSSTLESVANSLPGIASFLKFAIFLALLCIVGGFVWINRHLIQDWWNRLFAGGEEPSQQGLDELLASTDTTPTRPFSSFKNPCDQESDLRRIVVITFQAIEAWTREHGSPRDKDETPSEFAQRIAQAAPQIAAPAQQVVDAYNRIVYGQGKAHQGDVTAARKVWSVMSAS